MISFILSVCFSIAHAYHRGDDRFKRMNKAHQGKHLTEQLLKMKTKIQSQQQSIFLFQKRVTSSTNKSSQWFFQARTLSQTMGEDVRHSSAKSVARKWDTQTWNDTLKQTIWKVSAILVTSVGKYQGQEMDWGSTITRNTEPKSFLFQE